MGFPMQSVHCKYDDNKKETDSPENIEEKPTKK